MPNFKKSDGFSLGGNPFTMNKGSKEINTEGSFRQESTDKMGSYGSPLFAIKSSASRSTLYDGDQDGGRSGMASAVDEGIADGKKLKAGLEGDDAGAGGGDENKTDTNTDNSSKESMTGGGEEQEIVTPMESNPEEDE